MPRRRKAAPAAANTKADTDEDELAEFEVESLLGFRFYRKREQYKVRWKGFGPDWDTWEPVKNVDGCQELLAEFRAQSKAYQAWAAGQQRKPKPRRTTAVTASIETSAMNIMMAPPLQVIAAPTTKENCAPAGGGNLRRQPQPEAKMPLQLDTDPSLDVSAVVNCPVLMSEAPSDTAWPESPDLYVDCHEITSPPPPLTAKSSIDLTDEKSRSLQADMAYRKLKLDDRFDLTDAWQRYIGSHQGPPITVYNDVDDARTPGNPFTYINHCTYSSQVPAFDRAFAVGCNCDGPCTAGCSCYDLYDGQPHYDKSGRVLLQAASMITECTASCKCPPDCPNRVISRGSHINFQVFRTRDRGWGVRTLQQIPRGAFVVRYVGEVIPNEEAERRGHVYDRLNRTYLFDLDYYTDYFNNHHDQHHGGRDGTPRRRMLASAADESRMDANLFSIDAFSTGNVSHFINHSCDGNLSVHPFWHDLQDPRLHEIAFFANRTIALGEELSYDYSGGRTLGAGAKFLDCLCGSKKCRGQMVI